MNAKTFRIERFATPTGPMLLVSDAQGRLRALDWEDHEARLLRLLGRAHGAALRLAETTTVSPARRALLAYFERQFDALEQIDIVLCGTEFQNQVWTALGRIPRGATQSYGELASAMGRPSAVRAVGLANRANPIAIVVPCHRVIGANASLTGYAGGLERKDWLLDHEGARPSSAARPSPKRGASPLALH